MKPFNISARLEEIAEYLLRGVVHGGGGGEEG